MENQSEILFYTADDGKTKLQVRLEDDTVWLNQQQIALLFDKSRVNITEHIKNVFLEGELEENVVCRNFRHTTQHGAIQGKTQDNSVRYYNLDVIISVGYRVKSQRGTQFRIWATQRLKEYIVKGFALDNERLKQGVYVAENPESIGSIQRIEPTISGPTFYGVSFLNGNFSTHPKQQLMIFF